MRNTKPLYYNVIIFILAQVAWFSLLGLWINRYVTRHLIIQQVEGKLSPQLTGIGSNDWLVLAAGCILFVAVSVGMSLTFRNLNVNLKLMKMHENFIANMTHELKSPLASIQLFLETMLQNKVPREKVNEFHKQMLLDTDRLNKLINSILEIAGLEQKKLNFNCDVYRADETISSMIRLSGRQHHLEDDQVTITGQAAGQVVIEKTAMQILFDNLVDNAVKYSIGKIRIKVQISQTSKHIQVDFTDNGIGISKKDRKQIFTKFYRVYNENIPSVKGTGLGLYWVSEIIRYHHGSIEVNEPADQSGTNFHIELPIYTESKNKYLDNLLDKARGRSKKSGETL